MRGSPENSRLFYSSTFCLMTSHASLAEKRHSDVLSMMTEA